MFYRRFGRTGLEVSALTLGGGYVGGILVRPPEEVRLEALRRAIAAGCNWIDTAHDYGQGESERTIGRLWPKLDPKPHVSTKFRLDTRDPASFPQQIRRMLEESLARLGLDRVTLYQLHNPIAARTGDGRVSPEDVLRPGGIADVLDALRREGRFDWIGLTALGETPAILEILRSGRFDSAQVYFNLLNPSAAGIHPAWGGQDFAGVLDACRATDMGVMAIRVLAGGALASPAPHGREVPIAADAEVEKEHARAARLFAELGTRYGTRAQTAIRFVLGEPRVHTLVLGFAELAHLDEALAAFALGPLPPDAAFLLERIWHAPFGA